MSLSLRTIYKKIIIELLVWFLISNDVWLHAVYVERFLNMKTNMLNYLELLFFYSNWNMNLHLWFRYLSESKHGCQTLRTIFFLSPESFRCKLLAIFKLSNCIKIWWIQQCLQEICKEMLEKFSRIFKKKLQKCF